MNIFKLHLILLLLPSCCGALTSVVKFDVDDKVLNYTLIEFLNLDFTPIHISTLHNDSFCIEYSIDNPVVLVIRINNSFSILSYVLVNSELINFQIQNTKPVILKFSDSPDNELLQDFIYNNYKIKSTIDPIVNQIMDLKRSSDNNIIIDSLIQVYKKMQSEIYTLVFQMEDNWIENHPDSYVSLFIIYNSLQYLERPSALMEYKILFNKLDSATLSKYVLYEDLYRIIKYKNVLQGDTFYVSNFINNYCEVQNINNPLEFYDSIYYLFFYTKDCPHYNYYIMGINRLLDDGLLEKNQIIGINMDATLSIEEKAYYNELKPYLSYFIDNKHLEKITYSFWINHVPYGVIIKNNIIAKIDCSIDLLRTIIGNN